jgi:hypothetical protein
VLPVVLSAQADELWLHGSVTMELQPKRPQDAQIHPQKYCPCVSPPMICAASVDLRWRPNGRFSVPCAEGCYGMLLLMLRGA